MDSVYIAQSDLGFGLFAGRGYSAGEEILCFSGPVIVFAEAQAKGELQSNPLQIEGERYIDLDPPGVYANHSCDPNAGIAGDLTLIALRTISLGEEIRFDYSTTMWEGHWTMLCMCGSSRCRQIVRDFPELPVEIQTEYLSQRVVQGYIVSRLRESR